METHVEELPRTDTYSDIESATSILASDYIIERLIKIRDKLKGLTDENIYRYNRRIERNISTSNITGELSRMIGKLEELSVELDR